MKPELIDKLASYSTFSFRNKITLINIAQDLYNFDSHLFPISKKAVGQLRQKIEQKIGYNVLHDFTQDAPVQLACSLALNNHAIISKMHYEMQDGSSNLLCFDRGKMVVSFANQDAYLAKDKQLPQNVLMRVTFVPYENKQINFQDKTIIDYTTSYDLAEFLTQFDNLTTDKQYLVDVKLANDELSDNLFNAVFSSWSAIDHFYALLSSLNQSKDHSFSPFVHLIFGIIEHYQDYQNTHDFSQTVGLAKITDKIKQRTYITLSNQAKKLDDYDKDRLYSSVMGYEAKNQATILDSNGDFAIQLLKDSELNQPLPRAVWQHILSLGAKITTGKLKLTIMSQLTSFEIESKELQKLIKAYFVLSQLQYLQEKPLCFNDVYLETAILQMLYQQSKTYLADSNVTKNIKQNTLIDQFSQTMRQFLANYHIRGDYHKDEDRVTYNLLELVIYMHNILQKQPVSQKMFQIITRGNNTNNLIVDQAYNLGLTDKLGAISQQEKSKILNKLSRNITGDSRNNFEIYCIKSSYHNPKYRHSQTLIHGTKDFSVLNILGEGLIDTRHLVHGSHHNYELTGNGLGNGIYFARLKQMEKSLNYTDFGQSDAQYLFICNVHYNKEQVVTHYDARIHTKADLLIGKGVGSYDRDELVAQRADQVELKYLVKITRK